MVSRNTGRRIAGPCSMCVASAHSAELTAPTGDVGVPAPKLGDDTVEARLSDVQG
jgi:hypothetical protein